MKDGWQALPGSFRYGGHNFEAHYIWGITKRWTGLENNGKRNGKQLKNGMENGTENGKLVSNPY